jgi:protease IV
VAEDRSKGIVGIFILITVLFVIFLIFAFYTVASLKSTSKLGNALDSKEAPIAVIEVDGVIMDSEKTIKKLLIAEKEDKYKAIILRINSPGGAVGPTQEIYEEIRRIDKIKPIYASFASVAASGGYYLGAATRRIYAPAGCMTGSIGVIMNFMDLSGVYEWAKVKQEVIKAGKYKDIGNTARAMTDEERGLLTEMTLNVHQQFIDDIYAVREKQIVGGLEGLKSYAQGQIFSGQGAKDRGLVDEIAGLYEAGRRIHKELNIKEKFALKFIKLKRDVTFGELMRGIEESVEDIKYRVHHNYVPMMLYNP